MEYFSCISYSSRLGSSNIVFFFKQKTAYEMDGCLEFRRVLFRSVVERDRPIRELLPLLGALAGDDDDIAFACELDGPRDRPAAVGLDLCPGIGTGDDLADDRERVFAARIVRRDDRDVGELRREPPHQRPLAAVAIAARADHADDPAAARELAEIGRASCRERV